ncbi:MAG TPA: WbqC family protein [Arenibacter sp.]|nr:WbqC family protein [Arenibacter sp.]
MELLLHPGYLPNIANFAALVQYDICWEVKDNYQKQTYRNRCYIYTDQGIHMLNIPIKHIAGKRSKQKYAEVAIDNSYPWQRQHWRTLQTAYRTSPFFEFYEDEIAPLYEQRFPLLMDFNLRTIATICDCLQMTMPQRTTEIYRPSVTDRADGRYLVDSKTVLPLEFPEYIQVFNDRNPFIPNLSILDLLFNEGTNALTYLKGIKLNFPDA